MTDEHRKLDAGSPVAFDPPEFTGLADQPALRKSVQVTYQEALRWAEAQRQALLMLPEGHHGQFDHHLVRAAAEQTTRQHLVSPGAVSAWVLIVAVQGIWWHLFAPPPPCVRYTPSRPRRSPALSSPLRSSPDWPANLYLHKRNAIGHRSVAQTAEAWRQLASSCWTRWWEMPSSSAASRRDKPFSASSRTASAVAACAAAPARSA